MEASYTPASAYNQVPDLGDYNLYLSDAALVEGVRREGAGAHEAALTAHGATLGRADLFDLAQQVNRHPPELQALDRRGERIDRVRFHPGWAHFMALAFAEGMHCSAWAQPGPGAHVARAARYLMHGQVEAGSLCPTTMSSAAIPLLAREPWFGEIQALLLSRHFDERDEPLAHKRGMMVGMGLTERQGGSDLRSNSSTAEATADAGWYRLSGHKWFFSSPTSDAHLMLARDEAGFGCFYVPRWGPAGRLNGIRIQRLKSKVGNCSNASAEVEFQGVLGRRLGEPGEGLRKLLEMASYTRLDCVLGSAALLRQAVVQAIHYARHRLAFGRRLAEQPLMRQVLADLALESEAATVLALRLARAFDAPDDESERLLRRILTPAAKFWVCKRTIEATAECMEVWGGNGYIEDGPMPRLYREAPVNSIWEGSGNIMCLDVLRAAGKAPEAVREWIHALGSAHAGEPRLRAVADGLVAGLAQGPEQQEAQARYTARQLVLLVQADLLLRHAPPVVAGAFIETRLGSHDGRVYGGSQAALPAATAVLRRAWAD